MFNSTFNRNKKDPLVDSIKAIMEDTHMRNQAEGLVCEAFGVLNKNALANEEVTPFELACEEIYNQLKEGVQIDELHGKGDIGKIAAGHAKAYKKAQKDDKTEVSTDQRGRSYTSKLDTKGHSATRYHQLSGNRATLLQRKADGKKTNSDQLATIRQNAKGFKSQMEEGNDGNLANNYPPYGKVTRGDVIAGRLGKDQMGGKRKKMEEEQIDERNLLKRMKDTMRLGSSGKERVDRISGALSDRGGNWDYKKGDFTEKGKSQVKSRLKNVKGASDYALNKEETQIDELSRDTLKSYVKKASKDMRKTAWTAGKETESDDYWGATGKDRRDRKHISKSGKRLRGIQKATDRLEEEQIDELYGKGQIHKLRKGIRDEGQALSQEYGEGKYHNKRKRTPSDHGKHGAYLKKARKVWDKSRRADALADAIAAKNLAKKKQAAAFDKNPKRKISEEVFEELYISINEQALYAIETNQLEAFINNLTEEEYDFLDEEIVNEIVVQKSQMRPGETLGMTMNRLTGKTAVKGGANDPSSSNFKGTKPDNRPVTTKNSAAYKSAQNSDSTTDPGAIENAKRAATSAAQNSTVSSGTPTKQDSMAADAAAQQKAKPVTSPVSGPGGTQTKPMSAASSSMDTADSGAGAGGIASNNGASGGTQPGAPKTDMSAGVRKAAAAMGESINESTERKGFVTVGNMRIKLL